MPFVDVTRPLAINLAQVHRAIATTAWIGLHVILHAVALTQIVKAYTYQSRTVEEQILSTLRLLDKAKAPVGDACDRSLCHDGVPSTSGGARQMPAP